MEFPNYAISDLFDKWTGRLPMGDVFEKCVTLEWLQEEGFVPHQLVAEDVDDSGESSGKVIRLAAPGTVLAWKPKQQKMGTPSKGTPRKK